MISQTEALTGWSSNSQCLSDGQTLPSTAEEGSHHASCVEASDLSIGG